MGAGRPPSAALSDAILTVTLDQLATHGFEGARVEDIAERVGTSKQAIYRRHANKGALVAAAIERALERVNPEAPDRGDFRAELIEVLGNTFHTLARTPLGGAIRALVGELGDPDLQASLDAMVRRRRRVMRAVLSRAQERRELAAGRDIETDIDLLLGAAYFRLLIQRKAPSRAQARSVVQAVYGTGKTARPVSPDPGDKGHGY